MIFVSGPKTESLRNYILSQREERQRFREYRFHSTKVTVQNRAQEKRLATVSTTDSSRFIQSPFPKEELPVPMQTQQSLHQNKESLSSSATSDPHTPPTINHERDREPTASPNGQVTATSPTAEPATINRYVTSHNASRNNASNVNVPVTTEHNCVLPLLDSSFTASRLDEDSLLVRFVAVDAESGYRLLHALLSPLATYIGHEPYQDRLP